MKKLLLTIVAIISICGAHAQPTYQEKLYATCKMWGFVKYHHSAVSNCQVNWDSVLIANLPDIKNALTAADFNTELLEMLNAAGPMTLVTNQIPDTLPMELKRNKNYGWINDPIYSAQVKEILDTIKNNFLPHPICHVIENDYTTSNLSYLIFPQDSLMLNADLFQNYPNEFTRLDLFFRYWNILSYFNPYNYVLDTSWDTVLFNQAERIANAPDYTHFVKEFEKTAHFLVDAHVDGTTFSSHLIFPGMYVPGLKLRYASNKYIVVKSLISGISIGDEITSVDGLTPVQMEDSLRPYISVGNENVFHRQMNLYLIGGDYTSPVSIGYKDVQNVNHIINTTRGYNPYVQALSYYPNDTLANTHWQTIDCNTGYVHMGNMVSGDVTNMYNDLKSKPAIIFDIRNYPQGTAWGIADLMLNYTAPFVTFTEPDVTYPGTFRYETYEAGYPNNPDAYTGKVIILFDQETQSHAEFSCMIFKTMPDVISIGSQTAGADGNVTSFKLSQDIKAGYTNLGVFYPNGDSTQRIGIVPDITVYPTQQGIRDGKDEVLDAALTIACNLSANNIRSNRMAIKVYPNPANEELNIKLENVKGNVATAVISDVTGKTLFVKEIHIDSNTSTAKIDIRSLSAGMYMVTVRTDGGLQAVKLVKQ